jgi:hypothetical protein
MLKHVSVLLVSLQKVVLEISQEPWVVEKILLRERQRADIMLRVPRRSASLFCCLFGFGFIFLTNRSN